MDVCALDETHILVFERGQNLLSCAFGDASKMAVAQHLDLRCSAKFVNSCHDHSSVKVFQVAIQCLAVNKSSTDCASACVPCCASSCFSSRITA